MEAHPVGDDENRPQKAIPAAVKAMVVDTLGGSDGGSRPISSNCVNRPESNACCSEHLPAATG